MDFSQYVAANSPSLKDLQEESNKSRNSFSALKALCSVRDVSSVEEGNERDFSKAILEHRKAANLWCLMSCWFEQVAEDTDGCRSLALHRKGIRCTVLERLESLRFSGMALTIMPNG
ncbi:hypothetical protein ACET3Z_010713 [Daucus carota]